MQYTVYISLFQDHLSKYDDDCIVSKEKKYKTDLIKFSSSRRREIMSVFALFSSFCFSATSVYETCVPRAVFTFLSSTFQFEPGHNHN